MNKSRMMGAWALASGLAAVVSGAEFSRKPEVAALGNGRYRITFGVAPVSGAALPAGPAPETGPDVAVAIMDGPGQGRVIRHLGAGVLGKSPPPPFQANAWEQTLEWDGRDDWGRPVSNGTFRVRVSLGMGVVFDRFIGSQPQTLGSVNALAIGPAGEVYVYDRGQVVVLDRAGRYQRQIMPYPAELPDAMLTGLEPVKMPDGSRFMRRGYPTGKWTDSLVGSMAIAPDGKTLYLPGPPRYARNLTRIGTDGAVLAGAFDTRLTTHADNGWLYLVCSPDGRTLYMAGAMAGYMGDDARDLSFRHTVYRLRLDSKGPAESWVGDDENGFSGKFSIGKPKGLAVDATGNVYVCNYDNDDVAVYTPGGGFIRRLPVKNPQQVAVSPKTGHVYVLRGKESGRFKYGYNFPETMQEASLVHMTPDGSVVAELVLEPLNPVSRKASANAEPKTQPEFTVRLAGDFSDQARPVLWVGVAAPSAGGSKWGLMRVEDQGERFGEPRDVCAHSTNGVRGMMSRMALDRERDILYLGGEGSKINRYNALDGTLLEAVRLKDEAGAPIKTVSCEQAVGPDGLIYFTGWTKGYAAGEIYRATPEGKLVPFPAGTPKVGRILKSSAAEAARGFAVSRSGEMFVLYYDEGKLPDDVAPVELWDRSSEYQTALAKFNADGSVADMRLIRYLRAGAQGVRVDSRGGLIVADNFMPMGVAYPSEIARVMPDNPLLRPYPARLADASFDPLLRWMGCVVRFAPAGGRVAGLPEGLPVPAFAGTPTDFYRPMPENQWFVHNLQRLRVSGADWQFHGIAPLPAEYQGVTHVERCVCTGARFDVNPYDRVFVPDTFRKRFTVLDSAGNLICRFGRYGNRDDTGLGFNSAPAIAADANYAFIGDNGNRRMVRVNFTYAAEAECELRKKD